MPVLGLKALIVKCYVITVRFHHYKPVCNLKSINSGCKPESLNLTNTPPEIFNFIKILEGTLETISGVNSLK